MVVVVVVVIAMSKYTLENPFVELTFNSKPSMKLVAAFTLVSLVVFGALLYLYAVVLPTWIGFETTVLVGIAFVIFGIGQND